MTTSTTLKLPEALIFDMDGTLLETETLLTGVNQRLFDTLREEGLYMEEAPPVSALLSCLGMLLEDIWKTIMPGSSKEARKRADELLLQYEIEGLAAGEGELYPGVAATLAALKEKGVKLFVASNGLEQYVRKIVEHKGLGHLFTDLYSAGEYNTSTKVDLVAMLMKKHGLTSAWMVGDRSSDIEAAHGNGIVGIGCAYAGYGKPDELAKADAVIARFEELADMLDQAKAAV